MHDHFNEMILSEMLWPQVCKWLPEVEEYAEEIASDSNLVCQISDYVRLSVRVISAYYFICPTDFRRCEEGKYLYLVNSTLWPTSPLTVAFTPSKVFGSGQEDSEELHLKRKSTALALFKEQSKRSIQRESQQSLRPQVCVLGLMFKVSIAHI